MPTEKLTPVQNPASRRLSSRLVPMGRNAEPKHDVTAGQETLPTALSTMQVLAQQLKDKSSQLEFAQAELAKSKMEFVKFTNAISHDLRAPLRAVSGFSQYLKDEYQEQLDETADRYIDFVADGAAQMEGLITGLVRYSRVSKEVPCDIVDLNETFDDALMVLQKQIDEVGAVVTCDTLPKVRGDFDQLIFLLQSVIENGIKFNNSATPTVHVSSRKLGSNWCISVRDNGIGIAKENLECVFDIFRQLNPQQEFSGVGAGLAISRRIAENHSGQISLVSAKGNGALVFISLPIIE